MPSFWQGYEALLVLGARLVRLVVAVLSLASCLVFPRTGSSLVVARCSFLAASLCQRAAEGEDLAPCGASILRWVLILDYWKATGTPLPGADDNREVNEGETPRTRRTVTLQRAALRRYDNARETNQPNNSSRSLVSQIKMPQTLQ